MQDIFFENIHTAMVNYPYMDFDSRNINYFSHFHEEIEIIEVISGEVVVTCENETFSAHTGDICIFMPGELHSFSSPKENKMYILKINCNNYVENIDFAMLRMSPVLIKSGNGLNTEIKQNINAMKDAAEMSAVGYSFLVNSISNKILYLILSGGRINKMNSERQKKNIVVLSILKKSNEYIQNHYKEEIILENVAKYCGYSKYYFSHFFREITGITFFAFLTHYRLEKSIPELLNSENNIADIAYSCGFSNVRSYNRAFKSSFGITPSEYKKENSRLF